MVRLIRHAKSLANGSAAIARDNPNAELSPEGLEQIPDLRDKLSSILGGRALEDIRVNVSELWRTEHTAREVGFQDIRHQPILNESVEAASLRILSPKLKAGWLPPDTLERADLFLNDPDLQEEFSFSHGLFIASCRYVAGERPIDGNMRHLVPFYAEIVEIAV